MKMNIIKMKQGDAIEISKWTYPEPYSIYSMDGSKECIDEFLNEKYFSAIDRQNNLIGYFCYGEAAQVPAGRQFGVYDNQGFTDIGLGIKPELCGHGFGAEFLESGIHYAKNNLAATNLRLTVAAFNNRAIKVYEKIGFKKFTTFARASEDKTTEFWVMQLLSEKLLQ